MKLFVWLLFFIFTLSCVRSTLSDLDSIRKECLLVGSSNVPAYIGWPYEVQCDVVLSNLPDVNDYNFDENTSTVCQMWNADGQLLDSFSRTFYYYYEESHFIKEVTINESTDFVVVENLTTDDGNRCFYAEINLTLIEFKQESCEEFVENYQRDQCNHSKMCGNVSPTFLNRKYTFNCEPKSATLPAFAHSFNITYQFQRSCGETIETKRGDSTMYFPTVQRSDAGDYVCSVIYNGMTRYISMKSLCVKEKLEFAKPVIDCETDELRLELEETATFRCNITIGRGDAQRSDVHVGWKKIQENDTTFCDSFPKDSHEHEKIVCALGFREKCSLDPKYVPNTNLSQVNITFIIRNITQENYGNYTFQIAKTPFTNSFFLTLNPYVVDDLEEEIWRIVVAIIFVLILIGFAGFLFHQRFYLKVYYKRHFAPFSKENKAYGALLLYHYSRDIDGFAQTHVKNSITKIETMLKALDFSVYDERRNSNIGNYRAENITQIMEACHRVVILLTSEFIKDDWSLFSLQKGFNEMVNSRSKLIFILLPGVKEYVKQYSKIDDVYKVIVSALKVNHVIELPSNNDCRKFPLQMEYAMPKLKKETSQSFAKLKSRISNATTLSELHSNEFSA